MKRPLFISVVVVLPIAAFIGLSLRNIDSNVSANPADPRPAIDLNRAPSRRPLPASIRPSVPRLSPTAVDGTEHPHPQVTPASTRLQSLAALDAKAEEIQQQLAQETDTARRAKLEAFAEAIAQIRRAID